MGVKGAAKINHAWALQTKIGQSRCVQRLMSKAKTGYTIIKGRSIPKKLKRVKESGKIPLFSYVELETQNRCNGTCSFCPVNKNDDPREYQKMSESLFDKILGELEKLNYSGMLSLYSNNEPFLDERIEMFTERARKTLPNAFLSIFTNATVLSLDRFITIIPFIDEMVIDNYNDDLQYNKPTQVISDYCKEHPQISNKVSIRRIKINVVRSTRAGQAPNNNVRKTLPISCLMPYNQMVIRPDGKISLCCQDALGKHTLGDLSKQSLIEAWNSKEYTDIREELEKGRESLQLCRYCDIHHPGMFDIISV